MKRLLWETWETLKIGLYALLLLLAGFAVCCLGGLVVIAIVSFFTCNNIQ